MLSLDASQGQPSKYSWMAEEMIYRCQSLELCLPTDYRIMQDHYADYAAYVGPLEIMLICNFLNSKTLE